jgi:hypothetical protein
MGQKIPKGDMTVPEEEKQGKIITFPVLNGLHHDNRLAASPKS